MDRQAWLAVRDSGSRGQFHKGRERMAHLSAPIGYRDNPDFKPEFPASAINPPVIPFVVRLGKEGTYNVGRNKAKREDRAKRKAWLAR